jgi:hypothetical protein
MTDDDRIAVLEAKLARLEAIIEQQSESSIDAVADAMPFEPVSSRRKLLRNVAIATGGAMVAAVAANSTPAAAVDDPHLVLGGGPNANLGDIRNASFAATQVRYVGGLIPLATAFVFEAGQVLNVESFPYPGVLGGWTTFSEKPNGVTGYTTVPDGNGVVGSGHETTGNGVLGLGSNGVVGLSTGSTGENGYGVAGVSSFGSGVGGGGQAYSFDAVSANGAALRLRADSYDLPDEPMRLPPPLRTDFHINGEIDIDVNGDFWACVYPGTPGSWRKLAGLATAGAFHPLTPGRVYDSRAANPVPGPLANFQTRTISVAHRRELANGDIVEFDFVGAGATAISCNVTVVDTQGSGFLTINPGGNVDIAAAAINWSASNLILNNGVILSLNTARELTVICGGGGSTQFVIDVTGYFR